MSDKPLDGSTVGIPDEWANDREVIREFSGPFSSTYDSTAFAIYTRRRFPAALDEIDRLREEIARICDDYEKLHEELRQAKRQGFNEGIDAAVGVCEEETQVYIGLQMEKAKAGNYREELAYQYRWRGSEKCKQCIAALKQADEGKVTG